MLEFIQLLAQRYEFFLTHPRHKEHRFDYEKRIEELILAQALLKKTQLTPSLPLQIAMIGATQVGKSSLVNLFSNSTLAGVSALAGYTIHVQGFCQQIELKTIEKAGYLHRFFENFQAVTIDSLSKQEFKQFSLSQNVTHSPYLPPCILWDTPDFDAIDSHTYREGLLNVIALADVIVLVLSKEKYADQTVWDMMRLLEPLQQPTLICLNKISVDIEELLKKSLREKWQSARKDTFPELLTFFYQSSMQIETDFLLNNQNNAVLHKLSQKVKREKNTKLTQQFLQSHWQSWLKPIYAEHRLLEQWQGLVQESITKSLCDYEKNYLNHPHHYETFQHALANLLLLLEIPILGNVIAGARAVLLMPIKKMLQLRKTKSIQNSYEMLTLHNLADELLTQITYELLNQAGDWQLFIQNLHQQRDELLSNFQNACNHYQTDFQENIQQTAQRLYQKLEQQPVILNSLRATRATGDAIALAATVYAGGIGLHDLIIAPVMLTLTSLLAESAMGGYLRKEEQKLKQQQLETVKILLHQHLATHLLNLPQQFKQHYFSISADECIKNYEKLNEKKYGLKFS